VSWYALRVTPDAARRDAVAQWLVGVTGQPVTEQDDGAVIGATSSQPSADEIAAGLQHQFGLPAEITALTDVDWTIRWRDGIRPRQCGRLMVVPSWLDATTDWSGPRVVLDPENAFGSGEHGSTRTALTLLERHVRAGNLVLDLGSGSGILAIAAVRLGAARAIGIECDADAVEVAERNAASNGVTDSVHFLTGDAGALAPVAGPADVVLSNILRTVNVTLLPAIRTALAPDGLAIFAGMEDDERPAFMAALAEESFDTIDEAHDAGWWGVAARVS
jgi:ribosomal protein L11 methyltransferase